ncbi:unnamed protein product [Parascedosporium putredinis]|uniref:BRCT domain-containing protein n=1 Tax=Parascedosporium putredinis TaxID=1442378 RepID=A0A9P1MDQ7_9PEZI|nr:unnamed protein product [Parascedosporium putredinis]CAI8003090.1 unnamed protein product [Parascedosporium putredinis]
MVRAIFKGKILATAGPMPGQFTEENMARWTALRGGTLSPELNDRVTHLLATMEQFEKRVPRGLHAVKEALKRFKHVHLLSLDWFDLSCQTNKKERERDHDLRASLREQQKRKRELVRFRKAEDPEDRFVNTNLFHVFRDETGLLYEITLTRDDVESGNTDSPSPASRRKGNTFSQYLYPRSTIPQPSSLYSHLKKSKFFESNAQPPLYWFAAKFWRHPRDAAPSFHRPTTCSGLRTEQFHHFASFFKVKTGIRWDERVEKAGTTPRSMFQYSPLVGNPTLPELDIQTQVPALGKVDVEACTLKQARKHPRQELARTMIKIAAAIKFDTPDTVNVKLHGHIP